MIDDRKALLALLLVLAAIGGGVFFSMSVLSDLEAPDNGNASSSLDAVNINPQTLNISNGEETEMVLDLVIRLESGNNPQQRFEDVHLCVYGDSMRILESRNLGTFQAQTQSTTQTVNTTRLPRYVFLHHPSFRNIQGEHQILSYHSQQDLWSVTAITELPFEYNEMNSRGCQPPMG